MSPDPEHENDRIALLERLKQASSTSSLTLLSIVQGVALADLAGVVAGQYQQFHLLQWLLLGGNFLFILAAWNQILMDTITWVNLPSVSRSFIPFLLGALEFFLNHTFVHNPQAWLIAAAALVTLASIGIEFVNRAISDHEDNAHLLSHLRYYRQVGQSYGLVGSVLFLLLAGASALGGFAAIDGWLHHPGIAFVGGAVLAIGYDLSYLSRLLFYWRVITAYALGKASLQHMPLPVGAPRPEASEQVASGLLTAFEREEAEYYTESFLRLAAWVKGAGGDLS
jgi:hypothetical protein